MTKKELMESPGFRAASDYAEIWICLPDHDDVWPTDSWLLPFEDGHEHLIINTQFPPETKVCARLAARALTKMALGVFFYGNLFPYLRKRGKLEGCCELGRQGRRPVWLYDTEAIADLVRTGRLDYNPK